MQRSVLLYCSTSPPALLLFQCQDLNLFLDFGADPKAGLAGPRGRWVLDKDVQVGFGDPTAGWVDPLVAEVALDGSSFTPNVLIANMTRILLGWHGIRR